MQKVKVLAVEGNSGEAKKIQEILDRLDYGSVILVDNARDAKKVIFEQDPDVVLMDVEVNGAKSGLELAREITQLKPLPIVFLTNLVDRESFEKAKSAFPYGFVNKPFDDRTLKYAMDLAINNFGIRVKLPSEWEKSETSNRNFFVKVGNRLINLEVEKIRWIEVQSDYCAISTDAKRYHVKISLKSFLDKLPDTDFIQIHRRYVININYITHIDTQSFVVGLGEDQIPIGRTFRDELLGRINLL